MRTVFAAEPHCEQPRTEERKEPEVAEAGHEVERADAKAKKPLPQNLQR